MDDQGYGCVEGVRQCFHDLPDPGVVNRCQKEIVEEIRNAKARYVLAVKDNQPHLHEDLIQHFDQVLEAEEALPAEQRHETYDVGHGRKEQRFYYSTPVPETLRHREAWRDLASVGCVITNTQREGKEVGEVRYYISDQKPNAKRLAQATRRHWSIENSQHWVLDLAFREDDRRQQDRHGAAKWGHGPPPGRQFVTPRQNHHQRRKSQTNESRPRP